MQAIRDNLIETVGRLADGIGERSWRDLERLDASAGYVEGKLRSFGVDVLRQDFIYRGNIYVNVIGEVRGCAAGDDGILVVGAHYDTTAGTPGADDNASGVAGLIELARLSSLHPLKRTVRFVAFTLEERPAFLTRNMGSYICAKGMKDEGVKVHGMISLEMLGYYCDRDGCQRYPLPFFRLFYPRAGNFISFVGNISSKGFTHEVKRAFMSVSTFPVESLNTVSLIPGVNFSDHRSFWLFGYRAFMVTDTAFYRNPNYHRRSDTPATLDYDRMTAVVKGLYGALRDI